MAVRSDYTLEHSAQRIEVVQRVMFFTDSREFGGAERVLLAVLTGLDRGAWAPMLVHASEPGLSPLVQAVVASGAPVRALPSMRGRGRAQRWRQLFDFARLLRAERPAVFHAHLAWPLDCKYAVAAAAMARVPAVVATVHCHVEVSRQAGLYLQRLIGLLGVDRFVAVSEVLARKLRRTLALSPRKVRVIRNGIDVGRFEGASVSASRAELTGGMEPPVVLTVGRLDPGKGHRYLLEAVQQLPAAHFAFAGEGPALESLQARARELNVLDRVRFLGHRSDIPELLASCDVFVLPSLNEGLPISVLEAMAAGKPVVATSVGGTPEVVQHGRTGLLVPPADAGALATAMTALLSDRHMASELAGAGRALVRQEFTQERMVAQNAATYQEILRSKSRARG